MQVNEGLMICSLPIRSNFKQPPSFKSSLLIVRISWWCKFTSVEVRSGNGKTDFHFFIFWSCRKAQLSADQSIQINALLQRPLKNSQFWESDENLLCTSALRVGTEDLEHFMELYLMYLDVDLIKMVKQMFFLLEHFLPFTTLDIYTHYLNRNSEAPNEFMRISWKWWEVESEDGYYGYEESKKGEGGVSIQKNKIFCHWLFSACIPSTRAMKQSQLSGCCWRRWRYFFGEAPTYFPLWCTGLCSCRESPSMIKSVKVLLHWEFLVRIEPPQAPRSCSWEQIFRCVPSIEAS